MRYSDKDQPLTAHGKFALARALLLDGERAEAQKLVREAWRDDNFSGALEAQILDVFGDLIIDADHKTRMDMRLYAEDVDGTMRSANRAGGNAPVIAKARVAVIKKAAGATAQLDGVPAEARGDIGYIFSRAQWQRREEKATEAAELMLSVPNDPTQALDANQCYNAGRGRVKEWIAKYGDPRDPKIDPIDWVEQIPFSETRNYVQRVLENLQVYRLRFGSGSKLLIEADLRRGTRIN